MINGTSSKNSSKKMTYNSSGKSSGRHQHHHHHNQHHHGQNHHQGHHGLGQSSLPSAALANSSAMAAMLNQATMAAILTQYHAMPGMQGSNHRHQATMPPPPLNYFNFYNPSGVPDDPRYLYYHAQQSLPGGHTINRDKEKVTMKPEQQKVLYSKALQGSMSQSNSSPVTSASGLASSLTHPGNGTSMSSNSYHSKSPSGHFGHGSRNMPPLSSGNMRSLGKGSPQPSYSNRHNQPYHNSRIPSNTSSSSPPAAGSVQTGSLSTNGSTSVVSASGNNTASSNVLSSSTSNSLSMNSVTNGTTSDKSDSNSTISKTNLYIRGLTPNTTDKDLHSLCSPYGTIVSTKAILDKDTNRCKGYGFVDFENPNAAEKAVKSLLSQGVQAQMARCTETNRHRNSYTKLLPHEHDPTNLYIANLPLNMTEADLEAMLSMYGSVVSTRILKDSNGAPRGVGFARMESKEKCESIIGILNGKMLAGSKDTLLVKFADGGGKKKHYKSESRFRNDSDLAYDSTNMATNGVPAQLLPSPLGASYHQRFQSPYQNPMQANPWMHPQAPPPQYLMQPQMIPSNLDPNTALQYSPLMHQLTAQMSHLQLGGGAGYMAGNPHAYGTQIYPTQMMPPMQMSGEVGLGGSASPSKIDPILTPQQETINPSQSASSGSASGEESQSQPQQQSQAPTSQQPAFQMCYNQK